MVISNTKAKSVYEANGERREWELGFDFDSNVSKLNIILEDAEGYQTIVEDNYLIEDGVVIYPSLESELDPIAEGYKIILFRSTPQTQETDLRDNVVEKGLDKLTLQVQELSEDLARAVKVPLAEEGVKEYQDLVLKVREERDTALEQIKEATSVVSDYTQASSASADIAKEEADRAVEASNTSVMASADAEASAIEAANLANEAKDAVSAYVNGLGAMRNAVIDLGLFEDNQRKSSSCIIDFDFEPLDVFIRFTDSSKNMWINGAHSFAGIEKVGYRKYKIFYSVSSEDFASQSTIKGPFYVQYVIKYSVFSGKPVMYRGRVDTVDQLPAEAEDGDLWYVGPVEQENKEEYVWHAGKWELLGNTNTGAFYTKEEIDNKVTVIDSAIDANADAIQKTRNDFIEADSELQQQINAHATEIATNKNDIDGLGDEVAEIESKIPEGTSDTNPLINKQQLLDEEMDIREDMMESDSELQTQINALAEAIQGGGGGGGSVPDNVYTQDNLIAGKNVTFTEVPPEGGIDEHTVAVWHFDGNSNWVDDRGVEYETSRHYQDFTLLNNYKFGSGSATAPNTAGVRFLASTLANYFGMKRVNLSESFTIDWWFYWGEAYYNDKIKFGFIGDSNGFDLSFPIGASAGSATLTARVGGQSFSASFEPSKNGVVENSWNHLAIEYYVQDNQVLATAFVNGKPAASTNFAASSSAELDTFQFGGWPNSQYFDEVRISKIARYKGVDFSDSLPSKPYTLATGPSKTAVNAVIPTKLSELENDAGFITGGGSAEIPDNVYTADNLVSGDNITFTSKEAMFDAEIVGSPVISDNYEVSGFSDNDYLEIDDPIASASKYDSFEIGFAFNANTLATSNAGIYDGGEGGSGGYRITIHYQNVRVRIITSSSGYYGVDLIGSTTLDTGKKYYAKVNYSSETGYTLSLKEEGGEWVVDASTSTTTTPYPASSRSISIGDNKGGAGFTFDGTIYLPEMYINIDGKRVWTGFLPDRTVVSADNVYTKANLLGGKDIEIVPEPVEGGIDEYTLGVFHFDDGYTVNAVSGKDALGNQAQMLDSNYAKFGTKSGKGFDSNQAYINYYNNTGLTEEGDWTVDHWARFSGSGSKYQASLGVGKTETSYDWWVQFNTNTQLVYVLSNSDATIGKVVTKASASISLPINEWVHLAAEKQGNTINGYLNGVKVISYTDSSVRNTLSTRRLETYPYCYIDELRFSTVARYKGQNFTPPTQPYRKAEPTGNMVVNFVGKAESGASRNIGEVYYSQSSLATDNSGALPLWTGESVATAMYPSLTEWVTKHTELQCTAEEYESALSTYGECPKYVISNGTLRLPKHKISERYLISSKSATSSDPNWYNLYSDGWLEQGGKLTFADATVKDVVFPKPFADTNYIWTQGQMTKNFANAQFYNGWGLESYSETGFRVTNSTNGTNEIAWAACGQSSLASGGKIEYPWVTAYTSAIEASVAQAAEFQQGLSGKADTDLGNIPTNYDYVVESYKEGNNWYRVYKSGWLEQGGTTDSLTGEATVNLLKPFEDSNYTLLVSADTPNVVCTIHHRDKTNTLFYVWVGGTNGAAQTAKRNWRACGQGA